MKKTLLITATLLLLFAFTPNVMAQEDESSSNWGASLDIYSSYIWRGTKFGTGAAFQPGVEFSTGAFAIGGWGSVSTGSEEALEMDLYASYSIGGFSIGVTDYYFGGDWTQYDANHYLEPSVSFGIGDFSIAGYYMLLPATDATDDAPATSFGENGDMYFEAAYSFASIDLTLGAGDGQYTSDGEFTICNIGIGTSKDIKFTESFSLPLSGAVILNPSTGGFFIVAGISL